MPGKTFDARVVSGSVFIKYPPGTGPRAGVTPPKGFVALKGAANVPMGAQLDTRKGRVAVTSAHDTSGSAAQTADFYDAIFAVKQSTPKTKPAKPKVLITDLALKGEPPRSECAPIKGASAAAANEEEEARRASRSSAALWGNGKGKFRTDGKYSSATVRGTIWLTQDRCDGTLTTVKRGTVSVRDFKRRKTVSVKAGHSYLARAATRPSARSEGGTVSMAADARIGSELAGYRIEAPIGRGGMGDRLPRRAAAPGAQGRAQAAGARAGREPGLPRALRARVAPGRRPRPPPHRAALRGRRGRRAAVHQHALRRGHGPARPARRATAASSPSARSPSPPRSPSALDAAHDRGLVHRDVKPANILIAGDAPADRPEHCYLTDFGLTKDTSSPVELTATGTFVGTIDYIAPEQIEGAKPAGHGDQYALGCVLFECLTGRLPFARDDEIGVMWAHLQDEPPAVTALRPDLPAAIDAVVARALAKDPRQRYETCTALVDAARAALLPDAVETQRPDCVTAQRSRRSARSPSPRRRARRSPPRPTSAWRRRRDGASAAQA